VPPEFVARNGLRVIQLPNGPFEVLALPGTWGQGFFCAAGEYARVIRNAGATDRVIVRGVVGPSRSVQGGRSMVFEIGPPGPRTGGIVTIAPTRRLGASFPVATAQAFCRDRRGNVNTL